MLDLPPLNVDTVWAILNDRLDDITVNQLVWHYLGYRYDAVTSQWNTAQVSPEWLEDYPEPPDFIESRPATVKLTRSIPKRNKQLLKEQLGFEGYKVGELVPRLTRRATMANWLLSCMRDRTIAE
ncbi:MAG: DUF1823 family protein [Leptolyngbyaceae cyanobacterium SL_5_9]|nr:DUF1823 family protein [Leptolyngbyaceae cyanobacterium SL_5_9]NJO73962.1 DUF1823 family protein [Leptolyngbyaceae cyanobacterium RM1_406_9]